MWLRSKDTFDYNATTYAYNGTASFTTNIGTHRMCFLAAVAFSNPAGGCYLTKTGGGNLGVNIAWSLQNEAYGNNTSCKAICFN